MRLRKELAVGLMIAAFTGGLAWAQGATTPKGPNAKAAAEKNPVPADAASLERGKKLYEAKCAKCHKANGEGVEGEAGEGGPPPSNLMHPKLEYGQSDGEIHQIIKTGILPTLYMPMFEGEIKDQDIWDITNYVQQLRKAKK
jgi:cytochrome c